MSELPEDLVEEILCRVQTLSLKRLRPICKRWNRLFDDLNFKRKHSLKAPKEPLFIVFKMFGFYSMSINYYLHRSPTAEITYELNLINPNPSLDEFKISQHCQSSDGLLLCYYCLCSDEENSKLVVWNPYTGETKWIHICAIYKTFALGSYKDKKTGIKRYKILSHRFNRHVTEFELYDINSDSWRVLDDINTMECTNLYLSSMKSLKGKTYWLASDEIQKQLEIIFLLSFDYTTERFERLCLPSYLTMSLSVVREEKLSALVQPDDLTLKTEIWVTNKIVDDETKVVSWIKILTVDLKPELELEIGIGLNFLVDEEKKVLVCTDRSGQNKVYIVGEDNEVKTVVFGVEVGPFLFDYVPSLTQIQ